MYKKIYYLLKKYIFCSIIYREIGEKMEENSIKTSQNKCEKKDNIVKNSFEMVDINNFTLEELEKYIEELGEKK